ncbi:MAG: protein kinase [Planctomycetales bacterium]|nr:protein kinase [Planctomycetales bacterium]
MSENQQADRVGINIFDLIDSICGEFRRQWKLGNRPIIEDCLQRVPEQGQATLFRNLLLVEIRYRQKSGEQPSSSDYHHRFPKFRRLIGDAFHESTSMSMEQWQSPPESDSVEVNPTVDMPAANRIGNYDLIRELGRGGFGVVYEASNIRTGNRVALKTLPTGVDGQQINAERLYRFRREFRRLSEINHPNLVGMQTLEVDGSQWFFTMDLIEGEDFLSYVRPSDQLDESRLRACLTQFADGVMELHRRGIIHRDLKPSNVLVSRIGRVTILDFGLAAELQKGTDMTQTRSGMFAGTPRYAAPEQMFGERTEASDWYAIGIMLHEALTGSAPFQGGDQVALLWQKQEQDPPQLSDREGLPGDLAELADGLVRRVPNTRLAAEALAERFGLNQNTRSSGSTRDSVGSTDSIDDEDDVGDLVGEEIVLIGREKQLSQLESIRQEFTKQRQPALIWVSGLSGEGKSSLIESFLRPFHRCDDQLVLSGRCYDRESVPFKAIDSLIDALVSFLRKRSRDEVLRLLPNDVDMLAQLFPVLRRVPAVADREMANMRRIDDRQIRVRAFSALRELLLRVSGSTSVTLFIDDLQWGDSDSAEVLFELLSPPNPPKILFLGSYRTDEAIESPFLREWNNLCEQRDRDFREHHIRVEPLTEGQCLELMASRMGIEVAQLREQGGEVFADAHGNPYLLEQLAEGFDAETGRFQPVPLHEVIDRRLKRLPEDSSSLLEVIATAGQALSLEEAFRAAGHEKPAFGTISHMCSERLVRLVGSDDQQLVDTYHDKIRETVLANLPADVRRRHHLSLARQIEAKGEALSDQQLETLRRGELPEESPQRVFDLVYHFHRAGDEERTLAYAVMAARQARRQLALDTALEHLETASRFSGSSSDILLFQIAKDRSEALMLLGRYDEALSELNSAIKAADNNFDRALIESLQGETHHRNGQFKQSIACLENGLRRLGVHVPHSIPGFVLGILREVVVQFGHTVFPQRLHRRQTNLEAELVIRLLNWLSQQTAFENTLKLFYIHVAAINHAERFPISAELAHSAVWHGMLMAMLGWHGRGQRYIRRGTEYAKQLGDNWVTLFTDNCAGIGHFFSGRFQESVSIYNRALATFGEFGDAYLLGFSRFHRGYSHYMLGDLASAISDASDTFELAARVGDSRTMCASWLWARATNGNFPFEDLKKGIPDRPDDVMSTVHAKLAEGLWHSYHGRSQESLAACEAAAAMVRKSLCINGHTILVMPMMARALRLRAEDLQETDPRQCKELRRRSLRLAKRTARISRLFPAARALMLRELSEIQRATGRLRSALKNAEKSCVVAERQQATYELAQSQLLCGQLARQLELSGADQQVQSAEAELERFHAMIREAPETQ